MGLLQKASQQNINTPTEWEEKYPALEERLHKVENTIEFYPSLFKELKTFFKIEKGALLIREGEIFTLSSLTGYDETTKNRLRLTVEEFSDYSETRDIIIFQKYFSIREFVTTKEIFLFPFKSNDITVGLLLITEFITDKTPDLNELSEYIAKLSVLFRENPLYKLKRDETQYKDIKESITSYLQKVKKFRKQDYFSKTQYK